MLAHSSNLAIQSLCQDNSELGFVCLFHKTFLGHGIQNGNPATHFMDKILGNGFVYPYNVFLFVVVSCPKDFVYDVSIVGQKDQPLTGFVQSPNGKNPFGVVDIVDDVVFFHPSVGGTNNTFGFVKGQVNKFVFGLMDRLPIDGDFVLRAYFHSHFCFFTIDPYPAGSNQFIGFSAGAIANFAEVFVDAPKGGIFHLQADFFPQF
jgi:hypothetical protein